MLIKLWNSFLKQFFYKVKPIKFANIIVMEMYSKEGEIKKYSANYAILSKLILEMSEQQRALLIAQAKKITSEKDKKRSYNFNFQKKHWIFFVGINSGFLLFFIMTILFQFL
jgi:hypothetical protein